MKPAAAPPGWRDFSLRTFTGTAVVLIFPILALLAWLADTAEFTSASGHTAHVRQYYSWLQDTEMMVFFGFGLLMVFLRRYGYSAVALNFFLSCFVMIEAVLVLGAIQQSWGEGTGAHIELTLPLLIDAAFCAASAMIAFGAVIGKATPAELLWLVFAFVPLYGLNQHLVFKTIQALDVGGSITIHAFGAFFGLGASLTLSAHQTEYNAENPKNSSSYVSNIFSMIGTLFLWMFWPSFNGALASVATLEGASSEEPAEGLGAILEAQQYMCVVNTLISLLGSCMSTFVVSAWLSGGKINIMHVQNASLAGGVAVGSAAALTLKPAGALGVGLAAGAMSTAGFALLSPYLERKIGLGDTCGVLDLHGLPGILGGVVAGLASFGAVNAAVAPHGTQQLGWQILALVATVGIGALSGALVGWIVSRCNPLGQRIDGVLLFDDGLIWADTPLELVQRDGSVMGVPSVHGGNTYAAAHAMGGSAHGKPIPTLTAEDDSAAAGLGCGQRGGGAPGLDTTRAGADQV